MIRVIGLGKEFEISSLPDLLSILDKLLVQMGFRDFPLFEIEQSHLLIWNHFRVCL